MGRHRNVDAEMLVFLDWLAQYADSVEFEGASEYDPHTNADHIVIVAGGVKYILSGDFLCVDFMPAEVMTINGRLCEIYGTGDIRAIEPYK